MEKYSFLASIYKNTKTDEMEVCVESMINQTVPPEQIVIVIDGPIGNELLDYVNDLKEKAPELYTLVPLETNHGLGLALREGMLYCRNEFVARIDTDDINVLDRCEKQLAIMMEDPSLSVCGSNIKEFIGDVTNIVAERVVPEKHKDICKYLKKRCPINHMTAMLRKSDVEKAGGYLHWHYNEDSYLWARMYLARCRFYNIQESLVYARVGKEMYQRRGGYKYYKSERDLFRFMRKNKIINGIEYLVAVMIRFIVQVLMTNRVRQWFFKTFARSTTKVKGTTQKVN